jgi:CheY-like chemotaxis protein
MAWMIIGVSIALAALAGRIWRQLRAPLEVIRVNAVGRVLIVEDNPFNQIVTVRAVHSLGYECEVVSHGEKAIEAFENTRFDAVLMDCQMPGMDGYAASAALRRMEAPQPEMGRTPIIAMAANAIEGDQGRCYDAGMDDCLSKPIRLTELGRTLERWTDPVRRVKPTPAVASSIRVPAPTI